MTSKTSNVYADYLSPRLYASTPKAVFAAMAVSIFLNRDGAENRTSLDAAVLEEWSTLHAQRIVPQKPPTGSTDAERLAPAHMQDPRTAKYTVNPYRNPADAEPDAGPTEEQVNDWNIANDHQDRGEEEA